MLIEMKQNLHGYRQGAPWPPKGGEIDVPEAEAKELIANGYAIAAAEADTNDEESADATEAPDENENAANGSEADESASSDGDGEPTKEELLATAKELGLKVDGRSSAETIAEAIAAAEADTNDED